LPRASGEPPHPNHPDPERRLRVGYVSPDFREHSVSAFLDPVIAGHDRRWFEVFCYAEVVRPDDTTARFRGLSDGWCSTLGMTDGAVAGRIRDDGIDILVDLAGHTAGNRLRVFAERPAPVQVTWLGYPNTTGLSAMDYRLSDAVADPAGEADALHSETLVRLANGFLCFAPPADAPEVGETPALATGQVTFGSFNNLAKVTPDVVEAWADILNRIPNSRLVLKSRPLADEKTRERYLEMFGAHGVDPGRVELCSWIASKSGHLGAYERLDIGLDPFPYNGTTTTCEALWMGVPVVTLGGDRHAGRVGASILARVGLAGLVAETKADYVEQAVALAGDLDRLSALRGGLRSRMEKSPLCDAGGFARDIEAAYREMWRRVCA
jgi:predicted O-linked N-acetylglucosamine transferase (SPINDLY family)